MGRAKHRRVTLCRTSYLERATSGVWELNRLRIAAECRAAGYVGGDFYVVVPRDGGRVAVAVGDACGRGPDGARLLPTFLPRVRELVQSNVKPARVLAELNHSAAHLLPLDRFVTLAVLEIDPVAGELVAASAGHVPVLVRSAAGQVEMIGRASGPPLGIVAGATYVDEGASFMRGDLLVLMTDGLLEAIESDLAGMSRLRSMLGAAPDDAESVRRSLLGALDRPGKARRADDVTLLCVESMAGNPSVFHAHQRARSACASLS